MARVTQKHLGASLVRDFGSLGVVLLVLTVLILPAQASFAFEYSPQKVVASYKDAQGNHWEVLTDVVRRRLDETPELASDIVFFRNGSPATARNKDLDAFANYIEASVSAGAVSPVADLPDDIYSDEGYWRPGCYEAKSLACGSAAVGFGFDERAKIYKKLLRDAVLSTNLEGLVPEEYVKLRSGTEIYTSELPNEIERTIRAGLEAHGMYEEGRDLLESLTKLYKANPSYELPIPESVKGLSDTVSVIESWASHYDQVVGAHQYVVLREFLAKADFVHQRLDIIAEVVRRAQNKAEVDPALAAATIDLHEEMLGEVETFAERLADSYTQLASDTMVDTLEGMASNSQFYIMMLDGLQGKFRMAASAKNFLKKMKAGAFANGVAGIKEGYQTYQVATDKWRNLFLAYSLNQVIGSVNSDIVNDLYSSQFQGSDEEPILTYGPTKRESLKAYSDVTASLAKSYYDYALMLVDSNWGTTINQVIDGSLASMKAPQFYALHYSSAAISFGSNTSAELSAFIYDDAVTAAKNDVERIVEDATLRGRVLGKWSPLISGYEDSDGDGYPDSIEPFPETDGNLAPEADLDASSLEVEVGERVYLNAEQSSDSDGDSLSFQWQLSKPFESDTRFEIDGDKSSFLPDIPGQYEVRLTVSDGNEESTPVTARISVTSTTTPVGPIEDLNQYLLGSSSEGEDGHKGWSAGLNAQDRWCLNVGEGANNGCINAGQWVSDIDFWVFGHDGDQPVGLAARKGQPPEMFTITTDGGSVITGFDEYDWQGEGTSRGESLHIEAPSEGTYYLAAYAFDDFEKAAIHFGIRTSDDVDSDGVINSEDAFPRDADRQFDSDGDGVADQNDDFPADPAASIDSDGDGYPDKWNDGYSGNDSTTGLKLDHPDFVDDPVESADSDGDGIGDNTDQFKNDPAASVDTDQDGAPDSWNDGYSASDSVSGLHLDHFPDDPAASRDQDGDGYPDFWNAGYSAADSASGLELDLFPDNSDEWADTDSDGIGDNADFAPNDPTEWVDSDGDGVGDNEDVAPNDNERWRNSPPVITGLGDLWLEPGESKTLTFRVTDYDYDDPEVFLLNAPSFMQLEASSVQLEGSPELLEGYSIKVSAPEESDGRYRVIVRVDDGFGGVLNAPSYVNVGDIEPPVITAPDETTVAAEGPEGVSASNPAIEDLIDGVSAKDDRDGRIDVINNDAPETFPLGETTVTFVAKDSVGNRGYAETKVSVVDLEGPKLSMPAPLEVELDQGRVADHLDTDIGVFLASISVTDNVDDDVSVTHDAPDYFPLGETVVTATATDSAGNESMGTTKVTVTSLDRDSDGIPNSFENTYGLDPDSASDAQADSDRDGRINLDEYRQGSDPFVDDVPPELTVPPDVFRDATGALTDVELGDAHAEDIKDGVLTPVPDDPGPYPPGPNKVTWRVADAAGNERTKIQQVNLKPRVSFEPDKTLEEGRTGSVKVLLNGPAVDYPVSVPYQVSGSATSGQDYEALSGEVVVDSGTEGTIDIDTVDDGVGDPGETIKLELSTPQGAVKGAVTSHTLTLQEENIAPRVELEAHQDGRVSPEIYRDGGDVEVYALVRDPNPDQHHSFEWRVNGKRRTAATSSVLQVDPRELEKQFTRISVSVEDSGAESLSESSEFLLRVKETTPTLTYGEDSDGDGLSDSEEGLTDANGNRIPDYLDMSNSSQTLPVGEGSLKLETTPGMQLLVGKYAFSNDINGAGLPSDMLSEEDNQIGPDPDYDYVSGLFDFEVSGLGDNQVARVVIPLESGIPAGSVYRKFDEDDGWSDFVIDSLNQVYSSPEQADSCSEPGASIYEPGLTEGHHCLQLAIEDGGPNDADNRINGRIKDPGGVASRLPSNVQVSVENRAISNREFSADKGEQVTLRFVITANSADAELHELVIGRSGGLHPNRDLDDVRLYMDTHAPSIQKRTSQDRSIEGRYDQETGEFTFTLDKPLALGPEATTMWITYSFKGDS